PLYANVQARARIAKAQADARAIASAVSIYSAHMGNVPTATDLSELTVVLTNGQGQTAGPFLARVPSVPANWLPAAGYAYAASTVSSTFNISAVGDGATVTVP
ncbi:MAG TPA: type II secretion system protein GspG, partial [Methylomirabilota bacterium]|nr:type II secretion system protein GspG [Methylomirabilota bacterium]